MTLSTDRTARNPVGSRQQNRAAPCPSAPPPPRVDPIAADDVRRALALRDLTDPTHGPHGPHGIALLCDAIAAALRRRLGVPLRVHRASPVVPVADNYDRLGYAPDAAARDRRHTRYLSPTLMLRSHTTAMIPPLLAEVAAGPWRDGILACPGLVHRRDCIDRLHTGEPHQLELWRIRVGGPPLGEGDLRRMVDVVTAAAVPGRAWQEQPATHPYTLEGRQLDVAAPHPDDGPGGGSGGGWVEIGECGLAHPDVLAAAGLPPGTTGLAMGLGLDRLLMLRKGIDDIRLLRSTDPRIGGQMLDLSPYRPVSNHPATSRDLSIVAGPEMDAEQLGDRVRSALGPAAIAVESVGIVADTCAADLPPAVRERRSMAAGDRNLLVRVVLRHPERTLTGDEVNDLRDRLLAVLG